MKLRKYLPWIFPIFAAMTMGIVADDGGGSNDGEGGSDSTSGTIGTGNADRLAFMDAINDRNDQVRAEELRDVNDDETTSEFVPNKVDGDEEEVVVEENVDEARKIQAAEEAPAVTKIKVNGQEVELTPELIEKAQKIASADRYLEEASLARKATTTEPAKSPAPATPPARDVEAERLEEERALVRAIQMGTEEEAIAALRKVRTGTQNITPDQVAAITDERLNFNNAINWFNAEFKDLVDDPQLYNIVLQRDADLVAQGDKRAYRERYEAVGKEVREWRDGMVQKYAPALTPAPDPLKAKLDRKQAAPQTPTVANARSKPAATDDEADESTSDVIEKMRQARGGPQWARA